MRKSVDESESVKAVRGLRRGRWGGDFRREHSIDGAQTVAWQSAAPSNRSLIVDPPRAGVRLRMGVLTMRIGCDGLRRRYCCPRWCPAGGKDVYRPRDSLLFSTAQSVAAPAGILLAPYSKPVRSVSIPDTPCSSSVSRSFG